MSAWKTCLRDFGNGSKRFWAKMTPTATLRQINEAISLLIQEGLAAHQNYPAEKLIDGVLHIGISGSPELSISLKTIPYKEVYHGLLAAGAYHLKLIDGALIQMLYTFSQGVLASHRLAFFPSPTLETYDAASDSFEKDELFAEIFDVGTVRVPLRFDYSDSDKEYIEIDHPRSHLTLGQYKGCRIPVASPITPLRFMRFLLRNFYNSVYSEINFDAKAQETMFSDSISDPERKILHIVG